MSTLRDIPFQELLHQTAEHCGLDSERIGVSEGRGFATFLTTAAREMLRENDWPGSIVTEQRTSDIAPFDPASEYAHGEQVRVTLAGAHTYWQARELVTAASSTASFIGDVTATRDWGDDLFCMEFALEDGATEPEVGQWLIYDGTTYSEVMAVEWDLDADVHYVAVSKTSAFATGGSVVGKTISFCAMPTDGDETAEASWTACTPALRISYEQTGETPILDVLACYAEDPANTSSPRPMSYTLDETGLRLDSDDTEGVWVQFRKCPPRFTIALYSSETTYAIGDLAVVWPHAYRCIQAGDDHAPASSPTYWQAQTLPEKVSESVCLDAAMRYLRSKGEFAQANALKSDREDALDRASRVRNRQEGQTRTYGVATRHNATTNNYRPRRAALN